MSDEIDLFGMELEKYKEKYETVIAKAEDKDFVDELFESSDGTPVKNWSIDDINKLITDVDNLPDVEQAGEDFEFDRYGEYSEPKQPVFSETQVQEKEEPATETYDKSAVYFSKEYEQDLASRTSVVDEIPTDFEDISSVSENYTEPEDDYNEEETLIINTENSEEVVEEEFSSKEPAEEKNDDVVLATDVFAEEPEKHEIFAPLEIIEDEINYDNSADFFDEVPDGDFTYVEGNINQARADGEFREIDENFIDDEFENNEVVYDGTFDRGDYLKIKDIFRNSKILSKRRAERAEVRESAMETVKEKYGEAIFEAKKKEEDFNAILRRQRVVEKEKQEQIIQENLTREKRFDLEKQEYVVSAEPETREITIQEDEEPDDTIFADSLSAFEELAKDSSTIDEEDTRIFEEAKEPQPVRNIYVSPGYRRNDDQLKFEGFPEDEEFLPEEVNDDEVKENLRRAREEKKNLFRMTNLPSDYDDLDPNYFSPEKGKYDEEEHLVLSDENDPNSFFTMFKKSFVQEKNKKFTEYVTSNEKPQIFKELKDRRRRSVFGMIAMSMLCIVFIAVQLILSAVKAITPEVNTIVLASLSIVCVLVSFVFGSSVTQPGLKGLFKGKFTVDAATTSLLFALLATSVSMFFAIEDDPGRYPIYTVAVMVCFIITCYGRASETSRVINALKTTTTKRKDDLFTIQSIDDPATAQNIGRVFAGSNPDLKYSCKTLFPTGFIFNSFSSNPADKFAKLFFPVFAVLSFIVAVATGVVVKSVTSAFVTFMACLLVSFPITVLPTLNVSLKSLNKKLEKRKACITGYNAAANIDKTNAIIVDATDLFDVSRCNFHGMKDYGTVRVDDIILYAAAMVTNSRGPLAHVFDKAILGDKKELLPEVEDLYYEERLGLSGWIRGEKVFIGNRNLLINHNMEAPPKGPEMACLKEGKKVLYIAIDGKVAAMLVVEYAKSEETRKHIEKLHKNGITIVVATNDCNIDEEFLSLEYNLPRESFKVIGDFEGGLLDDYIHRLRETAPAKLIHNGTPPSLFETLASAISLSGSIKLTLIMQTVVMLLGLIFVAIFALSGRLSVVSTLIVVLIQVVSSLLITLVSTIRAKI